MSDEIVFDVTQEADGGYVAECLTGAIVSGSLFRPIMNFVSKRCPRSFGSSQDTRV